MNTKLWELKEQVEEMIERHGDGASLDCEMSLKDPRANLGGCSFYVRVEVM